LGKEGLLRSGGGKGGTVRWRRINRGDKNDTSGWRRESWAGDVGAKGDIGRYE